MIRELFRKLQYNPITKVADNRYRLMWEKADLTDKVYQEDENGERVVDEEGNFIVIGEIETDYCTCCHETVKLPKNTSNILSMIEKGKTMGYGEPNIEEWAAWAEVFAPEPERLPFIKGRLKAMIEMYDTSSNVNDFTISGIHLWLDSNMRSKVRENLESCEKEGKTETTLRINGMEFPVTIEQGWAMYYAVLSYARECWDVTQQHYAAAESIESVEDAVAYDYTLGYPEKLAF